MRVIKAAVERVWREIAQSFLGQFAQCFNEWLRSSHGRAREVIRFVLETTRPHVKQRRKPKTDRPRQQRKQQHHRHDMRCGKTPMVLETECAIKPLLTRQLGDRRKSYKDASDRDADQL